MCPVCKGDTQEVKAKVVRYFVVDTLLDKINSDNYNICLDGACNVSYFNKEEDIILRKEDIKTPIWFKEDADPKYICYCNKVTESQITDAIMNEDAKNMKDIIRITGAMLNGECETKNPLGKCCGPVIQEIIKKTLKNKSKIDNGYIDKK
nr:(2Fe-2S)-binding protein [Tissierella sp.]